VSAHTESVTEKDLGKVFSELGIASGDNLMIHSSLGSLGRVEGGADTVLDALLSLIGPKGNLMLPTFTYTRPLPVPYFDPATTPARTGIIPETGRKRPGAIRSLHPTHSIAVIGPDAARLTQHHLSCRAIGIGSPLDLLGAMGGKILLLGVDQRTNSAIHVAEEYAETPKVSWYPPPLPFAKILMPDGTIREHQIDDSSSCSAGFNGAEYLLRSREEIRDIRLGACKMQIFSISSVITHVGKALWKQPDLLLCTWKECRPCQGARMRLQNEKHC